MLTNVITASDTVTRPDNTTTYAAGDAISDNATEATSQGCFSLDIGRGAGGAVLLQTFTMHKSDQDSANCDMTLLIFSSLPDGSHFEDNAALAITDAEYAYLVGVVPLANGDWANVGNGNVQTVSKDILVELGVDTTYVWAIMSAQGAYDPAAEEAFTLIVAGFQY